MIAQFVDIILHLDAHLNMLVQQLGPWIYVVLFLIIFAETGLVVTPFLPGDSLLFATGAVASIEGSILNLPLLWILLVVAGIVGDGVNYHVGKYLGPKVFRSETSRLLNKKHLLKTQGFYQRYGGVTIIIARFAPIIRTFAPFVAGIGTMNYSRFAAYNVIGAVAWVSSFLLPGYYFGNIPVVKRNFHIIIFGVIFISILPMIISILKSLWEKARHGQSGNIAC